MWNSTIVAATTPSSAAAKQRRGGVRMVVRRPPVGLITAGGGRLSLPEILLRHWRLPPEPCEVPFGGRRCHLYRRQGHGCRAHRRQWLQAGQAPRCLHTEAPPVMSAHASFRFLALKKMGLLGQRKHGGAAFVRMPFRKDASSERGADKGQGGEGWVVGGTKSEAAVGIGAAP